LSSKHYDWSSQRASKTQYLEHGRTQFFEPCDCAICRAV